MAEQDRASDRSLEEIRAKIDSVDNDILQLLTRRNDLVAEVAQFKRTHSRPIRDFTREHQIIVDRRNRAQSLGLSSEQIESLFRLILWGSRDRQAALKAEVPMTFEPKRVAIIGGVGSMGKVMAGLFDDLGHEVTVADLDTKLTPKEAVPQADVVVVSVPIDVTVEVISQLGPLVRENSLLMDVTSIKNEPMREMLKTCRGSVLGTHPLFGPSVHSLQGQRVALIRGRGDAWYDWIAKMFQARGLVTFESTADEHDQAMAVVQVLTHFSTEVLGQTLARLGVSIEQTLKFTSPVYLIELLMTARHFAQSPELYGPIQMCNQQTSEVTEAFVSSAKKLADVVKQGDREAFSELFTSARKQFGSFTDQALEQSSFLIDRLVERI